MNLMALHHELEEKKAEQKKEDKDFLDWSVNAMFVDRHCLADFIDCRPEGNYENFQHLVAGDYLVYSELLYSVDFKNNGYEPSEGSKALMKKLHFPEFLYDQNGIESMSKSLVGTKVFHDGVFGFYWTGRMGEVSKAFTLNLSLDEKRYKALCVLFWVTTDKTKFMINDQIVETKDDHPLFWCDPVTQCENARCCVCGGWDENNNHKDCGRHYQRIVKPSMVDIWIKNHSYTSSLAETSYYSHGDGNEYC